MARSLLALVLLVALALSVSCEKSNPYYCHPDEPAGSAQNPLEVCGAEEFCSVSGATSNGCQSLSACQDGSFCAEFGAAGSFCVFNADTRTATCETACSGDVQCAARGGDEPICEGGICVECRAGTDCASGLCGTDRACVDAAAVAYAAHNGTGDGCTQAAPCSLTTALTKVSSTVRFIKLAPSTSPHYEGPFAIGALDVTIIGELDNDGNPTAHFVDANIGDDQPLIKVSGTGYNVKFANVSIREANNSLASDAVNLECSGTGTVSVVGSRVIDSEGVGIRSGSSCTLIVQASTIASNDLGGVEIEGPFSITNNFIAFNGTFNTSPFGGALIDVGNGDGPRLFAHNTVFENLALSIKVGGIDCTSSAAAQLTNNIIYQNQPAEQASNTGSCNYSHTAGDFDIGSNYIGAAPTFVSATSSTFDLHLTADLPGQGTPLSNVPTDIDGQLRSTTAPDIGADER